MEKQKDVLVVMDAETGALNTYNVSIPEDADINEWVAEFLEDNDFGSSAEWMLTVPALITISHTA